MEQKDQQKDYYTILNVAKFSDAKTCKKAFANLALKCHPDKMQDATRDLESNKRLLKQWHEIEAAHKVLSDKKKKAEYDTQLRSGCSHDVAAALFTDFSPLKNKEGFEFFSGVKEYIKHQQTLLNQYWQDKDLGRFAENYAKLRQFSTFLEEEVGFRKEKEFFTEMTYDSSYTYYPKVEFRVGESPNRLQFLVPQKRKNIFINLDADGKSLTFLIQQSTGSSNVKPIRLNVEEFRNYVNNSFKFEKIEKQITKIVEFLKINKASEVHPHVVPLAESDEILLSESEEEEAGSKEFNHTSQWDIKTLPNWERYQSDWVNFILCHDDYASLDAVNLVGPSEVVNQQAQESVSDHNAKATNEQQINAWHAPLKKQLGTMEEKYEKKLKYASTVHRLWASEKILTDYNEKLVFSFKPLDQKNNYNQIAQAPVTAEQSERVSQLGTGHIFFQNESSIGLAIHVLFQNIWDLFKNLVKVTNDTEQTKEILLLEDGNEKVNILPSSSEGYTPIFKPVNSVNNEKIMDEEGASAKAKKLLLEYIYNRGFEKKYAGFVFGFNKEEKMKAAELLYDVLYLNGDKHQLFENPKLLAALKQGRLGNIAKEAVETIEKELNGQTLVAKIH